MLTTRQSRVTGDADASLLPVHVHEPALQAAARRTEHLKKHTDRQTKKNILILPLSYKGRAHTSPNDSTLTVKIFLKR